MSDAHSIEPIAPVAKTAPVIAIHPTRVVAGGVDNQVQPNQVQPNPHVAESTTGGGLRAAYAQFVVNPDTNDVVIRIKDSMTNEVLRELPSPEVEAMRAHLTTYVQKLSQLRVSHGTPQATS